MKKYINLIIIASLLIFVLLKHVIPFLKENTRCKIYDEFLLKSFDGYVFQKFIDYNEHSYKTIIIKNFDNSKIEKILLTFDMSNLYNKINVNDTIYKELHNDSVFIIRGKQKKLLSKVDFGCIR